MAAPRNAWQVYDTTEPLLIWRCRATAPDDTAAAAVVREVIAALAPLVKVSEPLPTERDVLVGEAPAGRARSTLSGRDENGELHDVEADDAGALLRRLEPVLDEGYARRFAALGHPAVAVSADRAAGAISVAVSFFCTAYFDERDVDAYQRNRARFVAARDALIAVARRRGAQLSTPLGGERSARP